MSVTTEIEKEIARLEVHIQELHDFDLVEPEDEIGELRTIGVLRMALKEIQQQTHVRNHNPNHDHCFFGSEPGIPIDEAVARAAIKELNQ